MERRAILAAVLMAALLVIYQAFFFPTSQQTPQPVSQPAPVGQPAPPPPPAPVAASPPRATTAPLPRPPQRTATVGGPLYEAVVSSEGAKLQEWTLKYRGEKPMVVIGEFGPNSLLVGAGDTPPEPVPMNVRPDALRLGSDRGARGDLVFTGEIAGVAVAVNETLGFHADDYVIDAAIRIDNQTGQPQKVAIVMPW